jgi:hypothetical protein
MAMVHKQAEANVAYQAAVTKAMTIAESLPGLLTDNWPAPDDDFDATWENVDSMKHILAKLEEAKQAVATREE